jgi:hypothetical protein
MVDRMNTTKVAIEDPETMKRLEHAPDDASYLVVGYTRTGTLTATMLW